MVELALRTGIPIREWNRATDTEVLTALTVLHEWNQRRG